MSIQILFVFWYYNLWLHGLDLLVIRPNVVWRTIVCVACELVILVQFSSSIGGVLIITMTLIRIKIGYLHLLYFIVLQCHVFESSLDQIIQIFIFIWLYYNVL